MAVAFSRATRAATLGPPALWLALFFLLPFAIVLRISLSHQARGQPPYEPRFDPAAGLSGVGDVVGGLGLQNFATLATDDLYLAALLGSLRIAAISTLLLLIVGYPMAWAMARAPARWRPLLLALMIVPFWTSFLIRVYAWVAILKPEGLLDQALAPVGLAPLNLLNTETAIVIGIVYAYLPFMALPIYAVLAAQEDDLLEAAADLGATRWTTFWLVTVPLSWPGIAAGCLLVFIPAVGEFVAPDLLGGSETLMIGRQLWSEFFGNRDWPLASAIAVAMVVLLLLPFALLRRIEQRGEAALR